MILDKFLNESFDDVAGHIVAPDGCSLEESVLLTPDSIGVENAKAMDMRDMLKLEKAVLYAESVIFTKEAQGVDVSALSENVVTDFFAKLGSAIKAAWARMVEWFKNLGKAISIQIRDMNKSLEGVEAKLKAKDMSNFKYKTHEWKSTEIHKTLSANITAELTDHKQKIDDKLTAFMKSNFAVAADDGKGNDELRDKTIARGKKASKEDYKLRQGEFIGKIAGTGSDTTLEEAKDKIREAYGSNTSETEFTGLDASKASSMIAFLKGFEKNKVLVESKDAVNKNYKAILEKVDLVKNKIKSVNNDTAKDAKNKKNMDAEATEALGKIKGLCTAMLKLVNIYDSLMSCCMDQEKAKFKEYKSVIISAVRYSPKGSKES